MKTAFITGANQGIGFETTRQLATLGYFVYMGCRNAVKGQAAVNRLKQEGIASVDFIEIDISDTLSVSQAKRKLETQTDSLDVLINNAAIAGPDMQNIDTVDMEALREIFNTNFFGTVQTTQALLPLLSRSSLPVIVNVSSELGSLQTHLEGGRPNYLRFDGYSAAKTALNALTVLLSGQLKDSHFKINSVTPGYTATNLNQYQGMKSPEEAAGVIIKYATLGSDGPSGGFFDKDGLIPW